MAEIDSTHDMADIDAIIHDLRESHARTTAGEWGKGQTTHETVSRGGREKAYKIADFRHADDAQFCGLAHAFVPRLLDGIEAQAARIAQLDTANKEWHDKTDWLQKDIKPKELGMHRADVLRERIAQLEAQVQGLRDDAERYRWLRDDGLGVPDDMGEIYVTQHALPHDDDSIDVDLFMGALDDAIDAARAAKG